MQCFTEKLTKMVRLLMIQYVWIAAGVSELYFRPDANEFYALLSPYPVLHQNS